MINEDDTKHEDYINSEYHIKNEDNIMKCNN